MDQKGRVFFVQKKKVWNRECTFSILMTKFLVKKGIMDILYSLEVFDGFPEVPNKDTIGLKKVEKT